MEWGRASVHACYPEHMAATPHFSSRDQLAALAIVLIWGLNFVVIKLALRDFTPFQLGALRFFLAAVPLVFFIKPPQVPWKWLVYFSLGQALGQFAFLFTALQVGMSSALASVLMQTQVFFTALFAFLALGERLTRTQWAGLLLSVLGLGCFAISIVAVDAENTPAISLIGLVLTLCAAASWASSNIVARKLREQHPQYDPLAFTVWASLVPVLPFALGSALWEPAGSVASILQARPSSWLAVLYLGWIATVLAYALWTGLLKRHSPNRVAPFALGVPVVGIGAGMLLLGEAITAWQWAGIGFLGAALVVAVLGPKWMAHRDSSKN